MIITPAFQAGDAGLIPTTRSSSYNYYVHLLIYNRQLRQSNKLL